MTDFEYTIEYPNCHAQYVRYEISIESVTGASFQCLKGEHPRQLYWRYVRRVWSHDGTELDRGAWLKSLGAANESYTDVNDAESNELPFIPGCLVLISASVGGGAEYYRALAERAGAVCSAIDAANGVPAFLVTNGNLSDDDLELQDQHAMVALSVDEFIRMIEVGFAPVVPAAPLGSLC